MRLRAASLLLVAIALGVGCAGPGLEPPGDQEGRAGAGAGAGAGGSSGNGGSGGGAGSDHPNTDAGAGGGGGAAGTGSPPLSGQDASVDPDDGGDGGLVGADGGVLYESRELVGPTYLGSLDNGADCATEYPTQGHEPVSSGEQHPLFLYFVGTEFIPGDASASYQSASALAVTEAMARRGFVALSVEYDNGAAAWLSTHENQLACLFGAANDASLIARACALPNVDCDLGIATWGHSQGGYVAAMAYNLEPRVGAAWTTGYGGDGAASLPKERLRVVNGETEVGDNGTPAKLCMITGLSLDACSDPDQCLRDDGSGWIIVRKSQLAMPETSSADHCWFDKPSCTAEQRLEPSWVDPASDKPFALEPNADWVARTARR